MQSIYITIVIGGDIKQVGKASKGGADEAGASSTNGMQF